MNTLDNIVRRGIVFIPDNLLYNKELSSNELRILLVLMRMAKEAGEDNMTPKGNVLLNVTRIELASAVNVSLPTVYTCLKELEKQGYIRIKPQSQGKNGSKFGNSPVYLISEKFN